MQNIVKAYALPTNLPSLATYLPAYTPRKVAVAYKATHRAMRAALTAKGMGPKLVQYWLNYNYVRHCKGLALIWPKGV